MNILRHKKWHVRTKENVARVRRDEAKAAEEERARAERAALAEHEDRVRRLKARATTAATVASGSDIFGTGDSSATNATTSSSTAAMMTTETTKQQHVNLFAELEQQERTNTVVGNREYAAERKKEQDDWESKVGIAKRFAEDTKEYAKESEWWEGIPLVRERVKKIDKLEKGSSSKFMTEEEKRALKKMRKKERKMEKMKRREEKKRHRPRRSSSSSSGNISSVDSEAEQRRKRAKLDELRKERMVRERQEQAKAKQLFVKAEPKIEAAATATVKSQADEDRQRRYNSQFNPDLARS